jgi:RimJ/RimL family protein N-acetyltransferase
VSGPDRSLREWRLDDAADLAAAWADPEIARWNPVPADIGVDAARRWIIGVLERPVNSAVVDLVMVDAGDTIVGEVGLRIDRTRRIAEIGFWIAAARRGSGEGRRLLSLASAHADAAGVRGLLAVTDPENSAALALLDRAGWLEVRTADARRAFVDRQI